MTRLNHNIKYFILSIRARCDRLVANGLPGIASTNSSINEVQLEAHFYTKKLRILNILNFFV